MSSHSPEYAARVQAWVEALRSGSNLTWAQFGSTDNPRSGSVGPDWQPPGAGQLEVLRRLTDQDVPDLEGLADLVLGTPAPGRGLIDVPLPWPGEPASRFGSPPVSPEQLPADELVRVCAGVLVRLLAAEPVLAASAVRNPWRRRRGRFRLTGAPGTAGIVRGALLDQGLRPGSGARTQHVVLAGPFEQMMAQRWTARIQAGAGMMWFRMWRRAAANDRVPPGIAIGTIASRLAAEFGADRVHVVIASDAQQSMERVAEILGVAATEVTEPRGVLAADLLRVLNPLLALRVGREQRDRIIERNWPTLVEGEPEVLLGAPRPQLGWSVRTGERMAEELGRVQRGDGYCVHGDPGVIVPVSQPGGPEVHRVVPRAAVVDLGVAAIARAWTRSVERKG